ncbi:MAG: class I SAM-dependent methyltransferase [Hyphomicrobiales bacterium]
MTDVSGPLDVVRHAVPTLSGVRVVDIGCGDGRLARDLMAVGAQVAGVDPNPEAIARARAVVPAGRFEVAGAEALPLTDGAADLAVFSNALHHVPTSLMQQALAEARRVLAADGRLVVIEPDVYGSFFEVVKIVDDETEVRAHARAALDAAVDRGEFDAVERLTFVRREPVTDLDALVRRIVAVDPARAALVEANRARLQATFDRVVSASPGGLEQPHWAAILKPR